LFEQEGDAEDLLKTRKPLIVINDCISVSVSVNKENLTHQMSAILYPGDINYLTAIAPGDFVIVNMTRWDKNIDVLYEKARSLKPINGPQDGFKGVFKIQSVRKILSADPATGIKRLMYQITGFAFTEFNNVIYYNPNLLTAAEKNLDFLFVTRIGERWRQFMSASDGGKENLRELLKFLIESFLGTGANKGKIVSELQQIEQTQFYIPGDLGKLLGEPKAAAAKDIYSYIFGLQEFSAAKDQNLSNALNPANLEKLDGNFYFTKLPCRGKIYLSAEYWNQIPAWDILNQYINSPLNEFFTSFRLTPDNRVMPTLIFRQTPMTSEKFKSEQNYPVTRFLNLPRWKIDPHLIFDMNIGRDEVARVNFVQMFGINQTLSGESQQTQMSAQIAKNNYSVDQLDIQRSGLKPIIRTTNFDFVSSSGDANLQAPQWAKILGDALIGGHLKLNGQITCVGIQDPIAVGDNLEFDGTVFHIESITHSCSVASTGIKTFRTSIEISHGVNLASDQNGKVFSEMVHTDAQSYQARDYGREKVLPGLSDEQAIPERMYNEKFGVNTTQQRPFVSYTGQKKEPKAYNNKSKRDKK
jgi:hypothetical protein